MELDQALINRDYSKLPNEFWRSQNLCWYLHDVIMSMFVEATSEDLMDTTIDINNEEEADSLDNCDDVYSWLKERGRNEEFVNIFCKDLSMRLLGDFLNYIHEVLSNLERGKLTIACDLLRKPFKDNLLYLEWLLYNDVELSNLVYEGKVNKYARGVKNELKETYVKKIVEYNISQNRFINGFGNKNIEKSIYNIRYNYNSPNSLELVWNKATHLVTTYRKIKSENFNFIYNDMYDYYDYWDYLYGKLPTLLLYTLGIVENIFDKYFKKISNATKLYNFSLIMGKFCGDDENLREEFTDLGDGKLNLICENCKKIIKVSKPESYIFYNYWNIMCPKCKQDINTCRYFFLENYK